MNSFEIERNNSRGNITWSEMGQQSKQTKLKSSIEEVALVISFRHSCYLKVVIYGNFLSFFVGDVDGSIEAINDALETYKSKKIKLNVLSSKVGTVNENDIRLAHTFNGD